MAGRSSPICWPPSGITSAVSIPIAGDERCVLPAELWGKGEDYLWYSTGAAACATDLPAGNLGEGTLQARYIRGMFDDKPYTLGKYEHTRIRVTIAELAANGGAPMGFYTRFTDPEARKEIVRYYQFMKRHDEILRGNHAHAEVVLLFPRTEVFAGNVTPVIEFRDQGKNMLDHHVLFDVLSDEPIHKPRQVAYTYVFKGRNTYKGGKPAIGMMPLSQFDAPTTVRVSASRPAKGDELDLHFVNYDRTEPPKTKQGEPSTGRGIMDEQPIESPAIACDVILPAGFTAAGIEAVTPEEEDAVKLEFKQAEGRVQFTLPKFLVYRIARIKLSPTK